MNKSDLEKQQEEYDKFFEDTPFGWELDRIARDIRDRQNNAMAMEFTRTIAELLRENGIITHCTINEQIMDLSDKSMKKMYGVVFDSIDCTEHDKPFKDEIERLKHDLEEIEVKLREKEEYEKYLQSSHASMEREMMRKREEINQIDDILNELFGVEHDITETMDDFKIILKEKASTFGFKPEEPIKVAEMLINATQTKRNVKCFNIQELRQIAEHLLVYCNNNLEANKE